MKSNKTGFRRIIAAFGHSVDGIAATYHSEQAFRQDVVVCVLATIAMFVLPLGVFWRLVLGFASLFILFAELANTAIETVVDRFGPEHNPLSKKAKDIGSALVLFAFLWAAVCWGAALYNAQLF